jgi:hypothetical protein
MDKLLDEEWTTLSSQPTPDDLVEAVNQKLIEACLPLFGASAPQHDDKYEEMKLSRKKLLDERGSLKEKLHECDPDAASGADDNSLEDIKASLESLSRAMRKLRVSYWKEKSEGILQDLHESGDTEMCTLHTDS